MGWLLLALIGGGAFALMWRLGIPRALWSFAGAALMLGATGYALQGRPMLPDQPTTTVRASGQVDPALSELRLAMFGKYTVGEVYFVASDGLIRSGASGSAVGLLLGGINSAKHNAALWTALGQAYAVHDRTVSPAARFAFDQAMRLAPEHPGPPFFLGMAYVEAGQLAEARKWWARAYRLTPKDASYRRDVGLRLALLERYLAEEAAQPD